VPRLHDSPDIARQAFATAHRCKCALLEERVKEQQYWLSAWRPVEGIASVNAFVTLQQSIVVAYGVPEVEAK
jgi:hypothetical protein